MSKQHPSVVIRETCWTNPVKDMWQADNNIRETVFYHTRVKIGRPSVYERIDVLLVDAVLKEVETL